MADPLRLLPCFPGAGDWQMALDAWLLSQRRPALRLYRWGGRPTLSLGLHQRHLESHWLALARGGRLDLVRRPSGGRAVLHGGDLSYALVWPDAPGCRRQAYLEACSWLQVAFARMGLPLQFGHQAVRRREPSCFATSTAADLVHVATTAENFGIDPERIDRERIEPERIEAGGTDPWQIRRIKRIGSAQRWQSGCLLQHGTILLEPPAELWQELFGGPPPPLPPLPLAAGELESLLLECAAASFTLAPVSDLRADELAEIEATRPNYRVSPTVCPPEYCI
jgi:lipoate-protein ligase A